MVEQVAAQPPAPSAVVAENPGAVVVAQIPGPAHDAAGFTAWLDSLKNVAGFHDDLFVSNAREYLIWCEDHPNSIGVKGLEQPFDAKFRHLIRKKRWVLKKDDAGKVIGVNAPAAKEGGELRLVVLKSEISSTIEKHHVGEEGSHPKSRRCFDKVRDGFICCFFGLPIPDFLLPDPRPV